MAQAPRTTVTYPLDGSNRDFLIPFEYLARKFVQVTLVGVDRKVLVLNIDYRFTQRTIVTLTKNWGPTDGYTLIEIRRYTSATERLVDFSDGSILKAYDLNTSQVQSLHIAEEGRDIATDTIGVNNDGDLDARGRKIVNLADATGGRDAMNLVQVQNWSNSALNQANRAQTEADRSTREANRSRDEANRSKTEADRSTSQAGISLTHSQNAAGSNAAAAAQAAEATRQAKLATTNGQAQVGLAKDQVALAKSEADRATGQANLATTNGAAQVSLAAAEVTKAKGEVTKATQQADRAKSEADRATTQADRSNTQANRATTEADRSTNEADRAKTEADKLGNMNQIGAAIESVMGTKIIWKGEQMSRGRFVAASDAEANFCFQDQDGGGGVRFVRISKANRQVHLFDDVTGKTRFMWDTGGESWSYGKLTVTAGGMAVSGDVAMGNNLNVSGSIFANGEINSPGTIRAGSTLEAKIPASGDDAGNVHVWFRGKGNNERALIYADTGNQLHIRANGKADSILIKSDGTVFTPQRLHSQAGLENTGRIASYRNGVGANAGMYANCHYMAQTDDGSPPAYGFNRGGSYALALWLNGQELHIMDSSGTNRALLTNVSGQKKFPFQAGRIGIGAPGGGYRQFRVNFHTPMANAVVQLTMHRPNLHQGVGARGEMWTDGIDANGFTFWAHCEGGAQWDAYVDWIATVSVETIS